MKLNGNDSAIIHDTLSINGAEYNGQAGSKIIGDVQVIYESNVMDV